MLREVQVSLFVSGGVSPELSVGRVLELLLFMVKSLPICTDMLWTLTYLQVVSVIVTRVSGRVYRASLSLRVSADIFRKKLFCNSSHITYEIVTAMLGRSRRAFSPFCVDICLAKLPFMIILAKLCLYWRWQLATKGRLIKKIVRYEYRYEEVRDVMSF